jgi:uncharacterized membrane protein (DUF441 family)
MEGVDLNLAAWAADIAVMALALTGIVAGIRKYVWKTLDGVAVNAAAVALGVLAGAGLHYLTYFPTLPAGLMHGLAAGLATFLGVDTVRAVFKVGKPSGG